MGSLVTVNCVPKGTATATRAQGDFRASGVRRLGACLLICSMITAVGQANDERVPDLEVLRSSYIQAVSAIRSIDCRLTLTKTGDSKSDPATSSLRSYEVYYVRDGDRRMLSTLGGDVSGKSAIRVWASFDGKVYSSWAESLKESAEKGNFAPWGRIATETPPELSFVQTLDSFLGYQLIGGHTDLDQVILQPKTRTVGWEVVGGHRCVRIELQEHAPSPRNPDQLWRTQAWLDPEFDYLPRRIYSTSVRNEKSFREVLIEEFGRFESSDGGTPVYLPKIAIWRGGSVSRRMVLESAIVNQPPSADLFRPKFPVGARVKESIPGRPVRTYSVGGEEARKQAVAKATPKAVPIAVAAHPQEVPDARPPAPGTSTWFIVLRSAAWLALIVIVGVSAWRVVRRA